MLPLSVSLVLYKTDPAELAELFATLASSDLMEWIAVDNGANEDKNLSARLHDAVNEAGGRYLASDCNLGFGAGHNLALASQNGSFPEFHLMLNPDILLQREVLSQLLQKMQICPDVGLLMPKVVYADGTFQPVCKLLPTPADFALRRFAPAFLKNLLRKKLARYELEGIENVECDKVPFLSGCFLFARRSVLERVGGFDERFFLYLEDVDLCRRMAEHSKLLYWPEVSVVHLCYRGAYRSTKLMLLFLRSAIAYFQKWGWLFDKRRRRANQEALDCLSERREER